ncbi:MAG: bifunctional adenosylcobinamide kinase/adenosylcobinamide-phosphate guanylyltransferase [Deltaproteobacteria bacterium]|nr:MAG: bifunctional adenosylcobinamide kinase/adenosylcobinamide-phosphate guanylyltransferase [Deltaproteobacteria bacterium]
MATFMLVTGGTRSGKSSFALDFCETVSTKKLFVATCPAVDDEMTARIRLHQLQRRNKGWTTRETPLALAEIFRQEARFYDVILIDCLTLWVSNLLYESQRTSDPLSSESLVQMTEEWLQKARRFPLHLVCVTNEVGLGIVPENALARQYRDLVGLVNQTVARAADDVVLVSCGIPLFLKKSPRKGEARS